MDLKDLAGAIAHVNSAWSIAAFAIAAILGVLNRTLASSDAQKRRGKRPPAVLSTSWGDTPCSFRRIRHAMRTRSVSAVSKQRSPSPSTLLSSVVTDRPPLASIILAMKALLNPNPLPMTKQCAGLNRPISVASMRHSSSPMLTGPIEPRKR